MFQLQFAMKWIVIFGLIVGCTAKTLPTYIKRCKRTDPVPVLSKCVLQRAVELKPYLIKGIPELKIQAVDPLHIPKFEIRTGNGPSGGFNATFTDLVVYGLADFEGKELIMDLEKPYIMLHMYIPKLYIQMTYTFSGKLLLFELESTGNGFLNLTEIHTKAHHRKLSIVTRNEKEYLNLDDDEIEYVKYASGSLYFEDLFKDNPQLTEQTNQALNDNFNELGKELGPLIDESVRKIILGIIKPVFDAYSLDELFE